jgi:two-component system response regulator NreC
MIRILVVDDHAIVRSGLITLLNDHNTREVIGEAAEGNEAIAKALTLSQMWS